MNWKRFIIAFIVGYAALQAMDLIIHGIILKESYNLLEGTIFRLESEMPMWPMFLGCILFSLLFVWIYTHGVKGKGIMEGFRYGIYIGIFYPVINAMSQWAVYPLPGSLAWIWALTGMIEMIILGLIVGAIYKPIKA